MRAIGYFDCRKVSAGAVVELGEDLRSWPVSVQPTPEGFKVTTRCELSLAEVESIDRGFKCAFKGLETRWLY